MVVSSTSRHGLLDISCSAESDADRRTGCVKEEEDDDDDEEEEEEEEEEKEEGGEEPGAVPWGESRAMAFEVGEVAEPLPGDKLALLL